MTSMRKRIGAALGVTAVAAISYTAGVAQGKPVNVPLSSVKWTAAAPGSPIQIAVLWGDREKGPEYGMLLKMPAGSEAGRHSHTGPYHAVNVQGNWIHTNDGDPKPHELPPGSYAMQPGKAVHNDMCKGTTDCIIFVHQHAPGDFIPAK